MEKYTKLVRDKIPEILDSKGVWYEKRIASDEEYEISLISKLDEELAEFKEDNSSEELADILEVVLALKKLPKYSDVEEVRIQKVLDRGAFDDKIILTGEVYKKS